MTLLALAFAVAFGFAIGFMLGDTLGWDRCWQDLTKDDPWRAATPQSEED